MALPHRTGFRRKAPKKKSPAHKKIIVFDESGKVVFKGRGKRLHREQVFFDSASVQRRFAIEPRLVSPKRIVELEKFGKRKTVLRRVTFIDQRNAKHHKKYL
jgi:hypothetical protein